MLPCLLVCLLLLSPALTQSRDQLVRRVLELKREIQLHGLRTLQLTEAELADRPRYARQLEHATPPPADAAVTGQRVRLVGGAGPWEGAVEVHTVDGWRRVVADSWTEREAAVVCRQLGYSSYFSETPMTLQVEAPPANCSEPGALSVHKCSGSERSLLACDRGAGDGSGRPAGVSCLTPDDLAGRCEPGQTPFGDRCYMVGREPETALKAEILCRQRNATLATVTSQMKNDFLSGLLESMKLDGFHTSGRSHSLSKTESVWHWQGSSLPFSFTNWDPDFEAPEPGLATRCLSLELTPQADGSRYALWRSAECSRRLPYVCEATRSWDACSSPRPGGYSGSESAAESGRPCLPWADVTGFPGLSSRSLPGSLCRNPDGDRRPWCFTAPQQFEYCDVPDCPPLLPDPAASGNSSACGALKFTCAPGECVSVLYVCDGDRDCSNGRDEDVCDALSANFQAFPGKDLQRLDGPISEVIEIERAGQQTCLYLCLIDPSCRAVTYVSLLRRCTRAVVGLGQSLRLVPNALGDTYVALGRHQPCAGYQCADFQCANSSTARCDGVADCRDNSDELDCGADGGLQLRLAGGAPGSGRLEARRPGRQWGAVCDDGFSPRAAEVACRDLGFRRARRFWVNGRGFAAAGAEYAVSVTVCDASEATFGDCLVLSDADRCADGEQVSLECTDADGICTLLPGFFQCLDSSACVSSSEMCDGEPKCTDGSDESDDVCQLLRLRLREDPATPGLPPLVELKPRLSSKPFLSVSSRPVGEAEANYLCRELGAGQYGVPFEDPAPLPEDEFAAHVSCESEGGRCEARTFSPSSGDHGLRLRCSAAAPPPVEIRLVGGDASSGLLEIQPPSGTWGRVCSAAFNAAQAQVVCRQLGFSGRASFQETARDANASVSLRAMDCHGEEQFISDCFRAPWLHRTGAEACGGGGEVYLTCGGAEAPAAAPQLTAQCRPSARDLGRVYGGHEARPGEQPWLLRLDRRQRGDWSPRCGATLLSERLALTGAHCLLTATLAGEQPIPPAQLSVVTVGGERRTVRRAVPHPGHRALTPNSDDIALLQLAEPLTLSGGARPACLPPPDAEYEPGLPCAVAGYGRLREGSSSLPDEPRVGNVTLFARDECERFHGRRNVTRGMVCAGDQAFSVDTCTGDSGGPLTCQLAGGTALMGVTSWGLGCGRPDQPGVYTRVAAYLPWIEEASRTLQAAAGAA